MPLNVEAARAAKDYPTYAKDFTPENFYCTSVYANRYLTFTRGSAKNESIDGANAVVVANVREGKNELIPGFFPLTFTNVGRCLRLVSYAVRTVLRLWLRAFRPRSSLPSLFCLIESVFIIPAV